MKKQTIGDRIYDSDVDSLLFQFLCTAKQLRLILPIRSHTDVDRSARSVFAYEDCLYFELSP